MGNNGTVLITEPGFYDLPAAVYHGDPTPDGSLAQSAAKTLLDEGGPARFRAQQDLPRVEKKEWDLGTAAHALILGKGDEQLAVIDADNYRTKAAQEARDAAYDAGLTPLLPQQYAQAEAIADALPEHVRALFTEGIPEQSMFWQHETGLWLRGQIDYYKPGTAIVDLKTMRDTSMRALERDVWALRYYLQAAWYRRGVHALTGDWLPYYIVAVEKEPPYLCRVVQLSDAYLEVGEVHMDDAITTYLECAETGIWPGHGPAVHQLLPPPWAATAVADATIAALETMIGETQ